jgi:outer membrane protein
MSGYKFLAAVALAATMMTPVCADAADLGAPSKAAPAVPALPSALGWFVHVGPAGVVFSPSASVTAGGADVAGANIKVPSNLALGADIGYFITPDISASITLANPPTADVKGKGSLEAAGTLGKTTYLPPALAVQYHFRQLGAFQPYVGAGVDYMIILDNKDGALTNFAVKSNLGPLLQAGADMMFTDHLGLFVDVKHVWMRTTADGMLGATPVHAKVTLDPTIIHTGVVYRF